MMRPHQRPTLRAAVEWRRHRVHLALVVGVAVSPCACTDPYAPADPRPDVGAYVTGAAAAALDASGRFVFPPPTIASPFGTIDANQASALAAAYIHTFERTPGFISFLEEGRGAPIDAAALQPHPRVEFAESAYEPVPPTVDSVSIRAYGPRFLVRMVDGPLPTVNVAVSAYTTNMIIRDGRLVYPRYSGEEFQAFGIPASVGYVAPLSPEQAVVHAATETGARIVAVPELYLPHHDYSVQFCRWKLELDRDVELRGSISNTAIRTRTLYVGFGTRTQGFAAIEIPISMQPAVDTLAWRNPPLLLVRKANVPVRFEPAAVIR